ncbi:MAG: lipoprotein [Gammaproteobacteria bacterium]
MLCWSRYLFILVVIILGTGSMLSACGQKGPLVIPDESQKVESAPT